jgi:hypothetical protein
MLYTARVTWARKQIKFPKYCVLWFFRVLDKSPNTQYFWGAKMFQWLEQHLCETPIAYMTAYHPWIVWTPANECDITAAVEQEPWRRTGNIRWELGLVPLWGRGCDFSRTELQCTVWMMPVSCSTPTYPGRWIRCQEPIAWPPQLPDLSLVDVFL